MPELRLKPAMRPRPITWIRHILLLLLTLLTSTIAGVLVPFGFIEFGSGADPQTFSEFVELLPSIPFAYGGLLTETVGILLKDPDALTYGLSFSCSLLFILIAHEMGHYIACRVYRVDATLPYFIPTPPLIGPAGTLGAFIRIVSPMPSRRAVFDIGVAGPIAGFVALLPISILMIMTLESTAPLAAAEGVSQIVFSDPLLIKLLAYIKGIDLALPILPNPFYAATWVGLLVTALNLIPSGQLDGGHAIFAVFGARFHRNT
ncbi:MAG: site-2 protease family protein, partial [Acidobacteriota bacterium]|nr:site-2 protease family protein [Acidobacteriota bacterium]